MHRVSNREHYLHNKRVFFDPKVPPVLADTCHKLDRCVFNEKILPELWHQPGHQKRTYLPARIADVETLKAHVRCMDKRSMNCGFPVGPDKRAFRMAGNKRITALSHLGLRRHQRSMKRVSGPTTGFVGSKARSDKKDADKRIGYPSVRWVNMWLFDRLKMSKRLMQAQNEDDEKQRHARAAAACPPAVANPAATETPDERVARWARESAAGITTHSFAPPDTS